MLEMEGIKFLYYYGGLTAKKKQAAIDDFTNDRSVVKVLVSDTEAAGERARADVETRSRSRASPVVRRH
jgi:hypothetical protein